MRTILALSLVLLPTLLLAQGKKKPPPKDQPRILLALPFGVKPGATTKLSVRGLKLDTIKDLQVKPKGTVKILKKSKVGVPNQQDVNRVGDTQVDLELTIPADVTGDSVTLTAVGPTNSSPDHKVLLDRTPIVLEKEPNNGLKQAQAIKLGDVVQGSIQNGTDVDVYKFDAKAGQTVIVEVFAARLGSAMDSFLTLYDAKGAILETNDDLADSTDSRLELKLATTGSYCISVIDAHDQGGPAHPYRLSVRLK